MIQSQNSNLLLLPEQASIIEGIRERLNIMAKKTHSTLVGNSAGIISTLSTRGLAIHEAFLTNHRHEWPTFIIAFKSKVSIHTVPGHV